MPPHERRFVKICEVNDLTVFYIVLAILLFGLLILVHEFGHFFTAKLSGVQVNEFSLFMGPAIWKKQRGETLYALRCIPIGGYCAMEGEDDASDNPRAFTNAKLWKRLIILVAGSFMNFLVGFLLVLILTATVQSVITGTSVDAFHEDFSAYASEGLEVGDRFYSIDGERVYIGSDISMLLERNDEKIYDLVVIRDGEKVHLNDFSMPKRDYDGTGTLRYGFNVPVEQRTFGFVLSYSWNNSIDFARLVRLSLADLFSGKASVKDVSGPVGIVEAVTEAGVQSETVGFGIANVIYLFAFIAVNLAVMNLLPIPALDGGRVVCLLITALAEKLLRRKIDPKYEGYLHGFFMVLLMILMVLIAFKDIFHIFGG